MDLIQKVLACLPEKGRGALADFLSESRREKVTELRFRAGAPMSVTFAGRNVCAFGGAEIIYSEDELRSIVARLCEESVHTYGETMKEGYISLSDGARVGVCGRARADGQNVLSLRDVTSICVRIPHIIRGAADEIMPLVFTHGAVQSTLFYSPPGVGKTTLIRDVAKNLSSGSKRLRVSVVDSRGEIYMRELFARSLCDFLDGYPKGLGIEIATRTLSPEVIVCDEIGGEAEAQAILSAQNSGVPLIATAHASSFELLLMRPNIRKLYDAGIFRYYIGISRASESEKFTFAVMDSVRRQT